MGISYSQLNPKQKQAASHVHGPMLVLAGAGTGKTSVLVHRISRLINARHAQANDIRAFTFTHKAAREIRSRVSRSSAGIAASGLHASTFHGYCYQLLREAGEDFQLLDQFELWTFLRQRVAELPLNRFLRAANPGRFLKDLLTFFDRCSDELVNASTYAEYVAHVRAGEIALPRVAKKKLAESMSRDEVLERCEEISAIFIAVEALLASNRLLTFGALVPRAIQLLRSDALLLARERRHTRFLLVDEFQDSNHAQIELTRVLAGSEQNVFAVGDPDQAIYHFRGASSAAFTEFISVFDRLEQRNIINLAANQRSTQNILDCGFSSIRHNPGFSPAGSRLSLAIPGVLCSLEPSLCIWFHIGNMPKNAQILRSACSNCMLKARAGQTAPFSSAATPMPRASSRSLARDPFPSRYRILTYSKAMCCVIWSPGCTAQSQAPMMLRSSVSRCAMIQALI